MSLLFFVFLLVASGIRVNRPSSHLEARSIQFLSNDNFEIDVGANAHRDVLSNNDWDSVGPSIVNDASIGGIDPSVFPANSNDDATTSTAGYLASSEDIVNLGFKSTVSPNSDTYLYWYWTRAAPASSASLSCELNQNVLSSNYLPSSSNRIAGDIRLTFNGVSTTGSGSVTLETWVCRTDNMCLWTTPATMPSNLAAGSINTANLTKPLDNVVISAWNSASGRNDVSIGAGQFMEAGAILNKLPLCPTGFCSFLENGINATMLNSLMNPKFNYADVKFRSLNKYIPGTSWRLCGGYGFSAGCQAKQQITYVPKSYGCGYNYYQPSTPPPYVPPTPQYLPCPQCQEFQSLTCKSRTVVNGANCVRDLVGPIRVDIRLCSLSITVTKLNAANGQPLAGAVFEAYTTATPPADTGRGCVTDSSGACVIEGLPPGAYAVVEISPPVGFNGGNPQMVTLTNGPGSCTFQDTPQIKNLYGGPRIAKFGNNAPLAGATFRVTGPDGVSVTYANAPSPFCATIGYGTVPGHSWLLDGNGCGVFTIEELVPPPNFTLPNPALQNIVACYPNTGSPATCDAAGATNTANFIDSPGLQGAPTIAKVGFQSQPVAGASFQVTGPDGSSAYFNNAPSVLCVDQGYWGNNGKKWNLDANGCGTFTVKEIAAPPGYTPAGSMSFQYCIPAGGEKSECASRVPAVNIPNTPILPDIKIIKQGVESNPPNADVIQPLAGATFTLFISNTATQWSCTTDTTGSCTMADVQPGTYILSETKIPNPAPGQGPWSGATNQQITVALGSQDTATYTLNNTRPFSVTGAPTIKKVDTAGKLVSGAVIQVQGPGGFTDKVTLGTNTNPFCLSSIRSYPLTFSPSEGFCGDFFITEITAPPFFNPLSGPQAIHFCIPTDENGIPIPNQTPCLQQPATAIVNSPQTGAISVCKTDSVTGVGLGGAAYTLTLLTNNHFSGTFTTVIQTQADGTGCVDGLPIGEEYSLQESISPKGYNLDNNLYWILLNFQGTCTSPTYPWGLIPIVNGNHGSNSGSFTPVSPFIYQYGLNFTDVQNIGSLEVLKKNSYDGTPIAGAVFQVTLVGGQFTTTLTTNAAKGRACLANLVVGSQYKITEISVPAGFKIDPTPQTVTIAKGGVCGSNVSQSVSVTFTNSPTGVVNIQKCDDAGTLLSNVQFQLKNGNQLVATLVTNSQGSACVDGIPFGSYTLNEITPSGFVPQSPIPVTINTMTTCASSSATPLKITNTRITTTTTTPTYSSTTTTPTYSSTTTTPVYSSTTTTPAYSSTTTTPTYISTTTTPAYSSTTTTPVYSSTTTPAYGSTTTPAYGSTTTTPAYSSTTTRAYGSTTTTTAPTQTLPGR